MASKKRDPPTGKYRTMNVSRGSQGDRLACALLEQETAARARNVVRIRFHCRFSDNFSEMLFGLASIANVSKKLKKIKESMSKAHGP